MLEPMKLAWAWLAAGHWSIPYLLVTLAFYLGCYSVRKFAPSFWIAIASVFPYADALSKGEDVIRQVLLALPQVLAAAVLAGLATNDMKGAIFGAIAGAGAPILHHVRDILPFDPYKGRLGTVKPKGGGPTGGSGSGGTKDPEPTRLYFGRPNETFPPDEPAECRKWRKLEWRFPAFACLLLALVALTGCGGSAWEAQRTAANVVGHVANDTAKPALVAAYQSTQRVVVRAQPDQEAATAAAALHRARWQPVWDSWNAFELAHTAWQKQIDAKGDPLPAAIAAREAYCKLRPLADEWAVELPDFPLTPCPAVAP
jgi:hypothetical protein